MLNAYRLGENTIFAWLLPGALFPSGLHGVETILCHRTLQISLKHKTRVVGNLEGFLGIEGTGPGKTN